MGHTPVIATSICVSGGSNSMPTPIAAYGSDQSNAFAEATEFK
jgi:hypothetical protein